MNHYCCHWVHACLCFILAVAFSNTTEAKKKLVLFLGSPTGKESCWLFSLMKTEYKERRQEEEERWRRRISVGFLRGDLSLMNVSHFWQLTWQKNCLFRENNNPLKEQSGSHRAAEWNITESNGGRGRKRAVYLWTDGRCVCVCAREDRENTSSWRPLWCTSQFWPSEGAVGFDFSYPRGVETVPSHGKRGKKEIQKKPKQKKNWEKTGGREKQWDIEEEEAKRRSLTCTFTFHYIIVFQENTPSPACVSGKDSNHTFTRASSWFSATTNPVPDSWGYSPNSAHDIWHWSLFGFWDLRLAHFIFYSLNLWIAVKVL